MNVCFGTSVNDKNAVVAKYGAITEWDVSKVKNMKQLFQEKDKFNEDISKWRGRGHGRGLLRRAGEREFSRVVFYRG